MCAHMAINADPCAGVCKCMCLHRDVDLCAPVYNYV